MGEKMRDAIEANMHLSKEQYREFCELAGELGLELVEKEPEVTWEMLDKQLSSL